MIDDCSRGISDDNIKDTFDKVRSSHGCVVDSSEVTSKKVIKKIELLIQVKAMVQGRDRRPELGYKLALECRKNIIYPIKNKNSKFNNTHVNADGSVPNSKSAKVPNVKRAKTDMTNISIANL